MAYEAAEALMDDDVTSGDAVKFGEIINILKNLECFASTVEEVDLFNNLQNILITNAAILALSGAASLYALILYSKLYPAVEYRMENRIKI